MVRDEYQMSNLSNANYQDTAEIPRSLTHNRIIQTLIDIICIVITFVAFVLVYFLLKPVQRGFFCNDTEIFNPYYEDTVPFWAVGLYGVLGPIVIILLVELFNVKPFKFMGNGNRFKSESRRKVFVVATFHGFSLFILGVGITLLLTEIGKKWIGRLRPHFISVCKPNFITIDCTNNTVGANNMIYSYIATTGSFCTGALKDVNEARLSFPSGHASFSTYTMLFLIIYLEARMHLLKLRYIKPLVQMTAFIAAYVTCVSRISDYHHRGSDVIGGIVLGAVIAVFITCVVGRVIWSYGAQKRFYDFEQRSIE